MDTKNDSQQYRLSSHIPKPQRALSLLAIVVFSKFDNFYNEFI